MDEGGSPSGEDPAGAPLTDAGLAPSEEPQPPSLAEEARVLGRRARASFTSEPAWLLVGLVTVLALPEALRLWTSDPIFSLGFLVFPWAVGWVATRAPTSSPPASMGLRVGLLAVAVALALTGWFASLTWAAIWAVAAALALVVAERGQLTRGGVPAALVVLTAPPPFFEALMLEARHVVTASSGHVLDLVGIPVVRDALTLSTSSFTFSVEPQCVGMSSLLATVSLVGIVATHARAPLRRLGLGLLVGVLASLSFNLVRVVGVVASTEWIGPLLVEGAFHSGASLALGMLAFAVAIPALGREHLLGEEGPSGHADEGEADMEGEA